MTTDYIETLNPQQRRLVEHYLATGKRKESALQAGYSPKCAQVKAAEVLNHPAVVDAMRKRMGKFQQKMEIKTEKVLQGIVGLIERCEKGEPVREKDGSLVRGECPETGEIIVIYKPDIQGALKGYEMLGKHLHLFTDRVEVKHTGSVSVDHTIQAIGFDGLKGLADKKKAEAIEGVVVTPGD